MVSNCSFTFRISYSLGSLVGTKLGWKVRKQLDGNVVGAISNTQLGLAGEQQ